MSDLTNNRDYINEKLSTPVEDAGDVLVVGSGSAGFAAAIAAARAGARVTLIESAAYLGGNLASGLPVIGCHDGERQVVAGIFDELIQNLFQIDGAEGDPLETTVQNVDPEKMKITVARMLIKAGVSIKLHSFLVGVVKEKNQITHAIVECKGQRYALEAKYYVDASGDGDLAAIAGAPFEIGRKEDGRTQACTLMFAVGGIDIEAFLTWSQGNEEQAFKKLEAKYIEISTKLNFQNPRRNSLSDLWGVKSRTGERTFNATRVLDLIPNTTEALTIAELDAREQLWEFVEKFLRPHIPGFEKCFIAWSAAKIGVRETRRILGEYILHEDDILSFRKFEDTICYGSYPIDVHLPSKSAEKKETTFTPEHFYGGRHWSIPYRSLVPLTLDNILVAGRCISATHLALSAVRCMANTIGMGQAAGIAAAICSRQEIACRDLSYSSLRPKLLEQGAWLGVPEPAEYSPA